MPKKPNFLIVGAAKAGTTSLAKYLNQHPNIFIPEKKELRFFVADVINGINPKDPMKRNIVDQSVLNENDYFDLFRQRTELMCGEASVHYLYHFESAIPKIKKYLGDIPIIIVLREPVARAISNWDFNGDDVDCFENAIGMEQRRKMENFNSFWYYKDLSFYFNQVSAYQNNFSNVKIILFEDFIINTDRVMIETLGFLGLSNINGQNYNQIHNKYKKLVPRNKHLRKLFSIGIVRRGILYLYNNRILPKNILSIKKQNIDKEFLFDFQNEFTSENKKLQSLIQNYELNLWWKS